jgi:hypothetical protein
MSAFSAITNGFTSLRKGITSVEQKIRKALNLGNNPSPPQFDSGNYVQQKYNDIYHDVELYLENSGDFEKPNRYHINPAAVIGLHITDTVNDWVADGSLTFLYVPEGLPPVEKDNTGQPKKTAVSGMMQAAADNGSVLNSYAFRGDGYDLLRVMIIPNSIADRDGAGIKIDKNDTKWMLSYLFSVYEVEDVNDIPEIQGLATTYLKCLKLKFHDVRYQMLQTTNLEYSTSLPKDGSLVPKFDSPLALRQGVLHTGDILRDILNEALAKPENGGCEEFKIPTEPNPKWDKGKSEMFYTSPAQFTAMEDADYVFSHHVSEKQLEGLDDIEINDLCILHTDRSDTFGKIEPLVLTPLLDFFEKAGKESNEPGELQKEHFFITAATERSADVSHLYRAPMGPYEDDHRDIKTQKYGQIISYSFVDMSPTINSSAFCTTPVYSVDIGKREFNVEFKGNDVASVRKIIGKSYISKLFKEGTEEEKLFLPTLHKTKKELNLFPTFSLNGTNPIARTRNGLHSLLYTGLFQNACICFKTYGLTWRESGTFIGIDKTAGCADNDYNNKLYGQWFVVKVDHLFETGAYVNVIYAVKLHRHKELTAKFENTLEPV